MKIPNEEFIILNKLKRLYELHRNTNVYSEIKEVRTSIVELQNELKVLHEA